MSTDLFGLLQSPAQIPEAETDAVTDPGLDMVLDFMKSVINHELGDAWQAVCKTDPIPVAHVFNHDPDLESFSDNETPAIYAWRGDDNGSFRYSQDYVADESTITCLWVPPPAEQESRRQREPFRNGLKKVLKAAFAQGRHPAWVLDGDDYYEPEDYGSVLLYHAKFAKLRLGQFRKHLLVIESEDRSVKSTFECLLFTIEALELAQKGNEGEGYTAQDHLEGTISLRTRGGDPLVDAPLPFVSPGETSTFHVEMALSGLSPVSGPAAGGTVVTIEGAQFIEGMTVLFGTEESPLVELDENEPETKLYATAPAHAAGVVTITVIQAEGGVEKTLPGAFTYV